MGTILSVRREDIDLAVDDPGLMMSFSGMSVQSSSLETRSIPGVGFTSSNSEKIESGLTKAVSPTTPKETIRLTALPINRSTPTNTMSTTTFTIDATNLSEVLTVIAARVTDGITAATQLAQLTAANQQLIADNQQLTADNQQRGDQIIQLKIALQSESDELKKAKNDIDALKLKLTTVETDLATTRNQLQAQQPVQAAPQQPAPQQPAPQQAAPQQAAPQQPAPQQAAPQQAAPQQPAPQQAAPQQPVQPAPQQAAPQQPVQAAPKRSFKFAAQANVQPQQAAPQPKQLPPSQQTVVFTPTQMQVAKSNPPSLSVSSQTVVSPPSSASTASKSVLKMPTNASDWFDLYEKHIYSGSDASQRFNAIPSNQRAKVFTDQGYTFA